MKHILIVYSRDGSQCKSFTFYNDAVARLAIVTYSELGYKCELEPAKVY